MFVALLSIIFIIVDQFSKYLVVKFLKDGLVLTIIDKFMWFVYTENTGAAFGILKDKRFLFTIITVITLVVILYLLINNYSKITIMTKACTSLIIGGIIGNFIDRVRLGYVVDFISTNIFGYSFAVFNLADAFIVCGCIIIFIYSIYYENKGK